MTVPAVTTAQAVLAIIGLALLLAVAVAVLNLLENVRRPVAEIDAYTKDILDAGVGIAKNLDGVEQLDRTRSLAVAVPGLAVRYLRRAGLA